MKYWRYYSAAALSLFLSTTLISCTSNTDNNRTYLRNADAQASGKSAFNLAEIEGDYATVIFEPMDSDGDVIEMTIDPLTDYAELDGIPVGTYQMTLTIFDEDGNPTDSGSTEIEIEAGAITSVELILESGAVIQPETGGVGVEIVYNDESDDDEDTDDEDSDDDDSNDDDQPDDPDEPSFNRAFKGLHVDTNAYIFDNLSLVDYDHDGNIDESSLVSLSSGRISNFAWDEAGKRGFATNCFFKLATVSAGGHVDRIEPPFTVGWGCGVAYDSSRGKFVISAIRGTGKMVSYDPDSGEWEEMASLRGLNIVGLTYDKDEDVFYGVSHTFGILPLQIHRFNSAGEHEGSVDTELYTNNVSVLGKLQIKVVDGYLFLLQHRLGVSTLTKIDPYTGIVVTEGDDDADDDDADDDDADDDDADDDDADDDDADDDDADDDDADDDDADDDDADDDDADDDDADDDDADDDDADDDDADDDDADDDDADDDDADDDDADDDDADDDDADDDDADDDDADDNTGGGGDGLGSIEDQGGNLDINVTSVYAMRTVTDTDASSSKIVSFFITESLLTEDSFRQVSDYQCVACDGDDDSNCNVDPTGATPESITILFNKTTLAVDIGGDDSQSLVNEDGFPIQDNNEILGDSFTEATEKNVIIAHSSIQQDFSDFQNPALHKGTINFSVRPTAVDDAFTVDLDLTFADGQTFSGTVSGTVIELPTQPTPPTCGDNEYLQAIYDE